jgi:hypothetical protein
LNDEPAERMDSGNGWRQQAERPLTAKQEALIRDYLEGRSAGGQTCERYYRSPRTESLLHLDARRAIREAFP